MRDRTAPSASASKALVAAFVATLIATLIATVIAALLSVGCNGPSGRPNLVLITVDTTRADHFGFAGFEGAQTPRLDAFAQDRATIFDDAVTAAPITLPSHATILSGTYPAFHGVHDNDGYRLDPSVETIAEILSAQGYQTAAFIASAPLESQFGLDSGFDLYDDDLRADWTPSERARENEDGVFFVERRAERINQAVFRWLDGRSNDPLFLWVHYFDPHAAYDPPPPYNRRFAAAPYDGEIAYLDEQVGRLIDRLDEEKILDDSAFILVADHGESLLEHSEPTHATYIYDATMKVPLLISAPGDRGAGERVARQVRTLDLAPTALELLGLPPGDEMQGESLVPLLDDPQAPGPGPALLESLFARLHRHWSPLVAIRAEGFKYILVPKPELYDLTADPDELQNIAADQPERAAAMRETLLRTLRRNKADDPGRSLAAAATDSEALANLAALGYLGGAGASIRADPYPSPDEIATMANPLDLSELLMIDNAALVFYQGRHYEQSVAVTKRGLSLDPDNPDLLLIHGMAQAHIGNLDRAQAALSAAAHLSPDSAVMHDALARAHAMAGDFERAVDELEIACRLSPADSGMIRRLAAAHFSNGSFAEGLQVVEEAVAADPGNSSLQIDLVRALIANDRLDDAAEVAEEAVDQQPFSSAAHFWRGHVARQQGEFETGRRHLDRALRLAPTDVFILLDLAEVLIEVGDGETAVRRIDQARRIAQDPGLQRRAQELLERAKAQ